MSFEDNSYGFKFKIFESIIENLICLVFHWSTKLKVKFKVRGEIVKISIEERFCYTVFKLFCFLMCLLSCFVDTLYFVFMFDCGR